MARIRFIAFLPLAVMIASAILVLASSIVSALERTFVPGPAAVAIVEFRPVDFECDPVSRTLRSLSHAMMGCDPESGCSSSLYLCPAPAPASTPASFELEVDDSRPAVFLF